MKKLLWLVGWYIAGNTVHSIFNRKKGSKLDKILKSDDVTNEEKIWFLWDNFMTTQKKLVKKIGSELDGNEHVDAVKKIVTDYTEQWKELLSQLHEKGSEKWWAIKDKFEKLYESKKEELSRVTEQAPEQFEWAKKKLLASWDELKQKMK